MAARLAVISSRSRTDRAVATLATLSAALAEGLPARLRALAAIP
jgi:hypothetical protein